MVRSRLLLQLPLHGRSRPHRTLRCDRPDSRRFWNSRSLPPALLRDPRTLVATYHSLRSLPIINFVPIDDTLHRSRHNSTKGTSACRLGSASSLSVRAQRNPTRYEYGRHGISSTTYCGASQATKRHFIANLFLKRQNSAFWVAAADYCVLLHVQCLAYSKNGTLF